MNHIHTRLGGWGQLVSGGMDGTCGVLGVPLLGVWSGGGITAARDDPGGDRLEPRLPADRSSEVGRVAPAVVGTRGRGSPPSRDPAALLDWVGSETYRTASNLAADRLGRVAEPAM